MSLFRRLFPETLFRRALSPNGERRLHLARARAQERVIDAHVRNALMFVETLAEEVPYDRALDIYVREMVLTEPLSGVVVTRTLVALGEDLVARERAALGRGDDGTAGRPRLRLNDRDASRAAPGRTSGDHRAAG
jgi:hypothetical protein